MTIGARGFAIYTRTWCLLHNDKLGKSWSGWSFVVTNQFMAYEERRMGGQYDLHNFKFKFCNVFFFIKYNTKGTIRFTMKIEHAAVLISPWVSWFSHEVRSTLCLLLRTYSDFSTLMTATVHSSYSITRHIVKYINGNVSSKYSTESDIK